MQVLCHIKKFFDQGLAVDFFSIIVRVFAGLAGETSSSAMRRRSNPPGNSQAKGLQDSTDNLERGTTVPTEGDPS